MFKTLKNIFGSKYDRDVKIYSPVVEDINDYFESYASLSNDELRNKTFEFKERIKEHLKGIDEDIANLEKETAEEEDIFRKEELFKEVDEITKDRDKHLEDILKEILPEAFAVVKETARRFMLNESLSTTATEQDKQLAINKNYVNISGDQAVWSNSWTAAGAEITWNMLHYDVQLIGGQVLHDGKVAEMQTGEGKTLVATLPAYLNGLTGLGVHIVTVNNYLARRDAEWMGTLINTSHTLLKEWQPMVVM